MSVDFCDLVEQMRSHFFPRDRGITLAEGTFDGAGTVPIGGVILWSGAVGSIPTNWQLCDGTNGTPNLTDRFVVGAGDTYAVGATGGANTNNLYHRHASGTYTAANDAHSHTSGTYATDEDTHSHTIPVGADLSEGTAFHTTTDSDAHSHDVTGTSASDTHSHDVAGWCGYAGSSTQENRPPYYALAYIRRMT